MDRLQQDTVFMSPAHPPCLQTEASEQLIDELERALRRIAGLSCEVSPIVEIANEAMAVFGPMLGTPRLTASTGHVARRLRIEPYQLISSSTSEKIEVTIQSSTPHSKRAGTDGLSRRTLLAQA
jgi:hypothetical protein